MGRIFVLIKRKGTKRFLGAVPTRKGATPSSLKKLLPKQIKKGFSFKIVTSKQLKAIILRQRPGSIKRLKRIKRREGIRRRKVLRRRRKTGRR